MLTTSHLFPFATALLLALVFTPLVRHLALGWHIVDQPGGRKIHQKPVPLLGGLAIFLALALSAALLAMAGNLQTDAASLVRFGSIGLGAIMIMVGGFLDDRYRLKPAQQFIFPLTAALVVLLGGIRIQFVTNPLGGVLEFSTAVGVILAFFWLLGMMYTTKLLDGLDGLVAGITTIAGLIIFIVSLYWDAPDSSTSSLALILAGAALGFLVFNWHPASIFLGEGGSIFCGFMIAVLAVVSGSTIATALLMMGIPILDVLWVIVRRLWQGNSPVKADRKHLHFRLLDIGLSHRQAVLVLLLLTGSFGVTALFLHTRGKIVALVVLAGIMVVLATTLVAVYQRQKKTKNNFEL